MKPFLIVCFHLLLSTNVSAVKTSHSNNVAKISNNAIFFRGGENHSDVEKEKNVKKDKKKKIAKKNKIIEQKKSDVKEAVDSVKSNGEDEDEDMSQFEEHDNRGIQIVSYAKDIISKTPPMTQIYLFGSVMITLLSFAFNQNNWPTTLDFDFKSIFTRFQFWRIFTPFMFIGKLDIYYPLTLQFIWQHMSQLEKMNYNKPEEFLVMLTFGGFALISIYTILGISTKFLGHNLGTYLVYIWARVFEGMDVNFMDILTLKAEMLPWFFCAQSLILDGQIPFADLIGILAGHFYYYLSGKKIIRAPSFLKKWFNSDKIKAKYSKFKDDFE